MKTTNICSFDNPGHRFFGQFPANFRFSWALLIALDWHWVTLISWCQMNRLGHSSPVMHKVEGKTHTILEKLKITSGKSTLFWHFFVKYFQITCVDIWISLNKKKIPLYFIHGKNYLKHKFCVNSIYEIISFWCSR